MKKRILATLLAVVLVIGLLPMAALAAEGDTVTQVTEMKYDSVEDFSEGLAAVSLGGKWGFINTAGEEVIPCQYNYTNGLTPCFSEGLASVQLGDKLGYIDKTGREIISGQFDDAPSFMEGVAVVGLAEGYNLAGKQAVINKEGETIIDFGTYEFCFITGPHGFLEPGFSGGVAAVADGRGLIDKTGKEIFPTGKYRLMSYEGQGNDWGGPVEGLIGVFLAEEDKDWTDWKCGVINTTGEEVLPCEYDEILIMNASHVAAKKDGKYSVLDITTGEEVLPGQYDDISHLFNYWFTGTVVDLYLTSQNNETYGVIDTNGKEILPCTYQNISLYSEGYLTTWGEGEDTIIFDATGKQLFILDDKYDQAGDFSEGYRVVGIDSGKTREVTDPETTIHIYNIGFIDTAGNEVIPCNKYNDARGFSHGIAAVGVEDGTDEMILRDPFTTYGMGWVTCKWGAVDTTGREIIPCLYDAVVPMQCGAVRTAKKEGSWSYKYGLVDRTGKEILPCEYDAIDEWADTDLIRVRKDGKSGFISITKDPATPASEKFGDVAKDSWYEAGVTYVTGKGLFQGVSEQEFSPNTNMTRAMLMTVLARLDGQETSGGATWYAKAMDWAKAQGISDGSAPDGNVTREQLVTMLYRYAKPEKAEGGLNQFADAGSVSDWAKEAMEWAVANSIVTGKSGARLDPQGTATRAEVATIIQRFAEKTEA